MSVLKKIFILLLFVFPVGEIFRLDFGNGFVIKPLDIGIVILIFCWILLKLFKHQKISQPNLFLPAILFPIVGLFSLLISNLHLLPGEFIISFAYLVRWVIYLGMFFVILEFDEEFKKTALKLLTLSGSLIVMFGYIQFFYYSNLQNLAYLGWDEHMHRMFSVFFDPNFAGAFFVLFFLFLMNMFLQKRSLTTGLLIILTLGAVFLTFSRSALLMLIVSSCILFTFLSRKKLIVWLLLLTIIVIGVSSSFFDIANINLFRVVSSEARLETARNAIKIIEDHPLFGIGFNSYRYAQFRYNFRNQINLTSHADSSPDNSLLLVLATTGIVGFILYLYFWFRLFKVVSILAIASVAGIFVDSMFINSLFYPLIMFWLWIILAFSIKNHN